MTYCPARRPTVRERFIELTAEGQLYTAHAKLAEVSAALLVIESMVARSGYHPEFRAGLATALTLLPKTRRAARKKVRRTACSTCSILKQAIDLYEKAIDLPCRCGESDGLNHCAHCTTVIKARSLVDKVLLPNAHADGLAASGNTVRRDVGTPNQKGQTE